MDFKFILCCILICEVVNGDQQYCFTSVVCNAEEGGNAITSWIQISPSPKCKGSSSNTPETLRKEYNASLEKFKKDLSDHSSDETSQFKGSGRCYMPVVCSRDSGSSADWLFVHGDSCDAGITDEESWKIYDDYIALASKDVKDKTRAKFHNSSVCEALFDSIFQRSNASAQGKAKQCFAPVVCSKEENSRESWLEVYPNANCTNRHKTTTIQISMAKAAFDKLLHQAVETFKNLTGKC